MSFATSEVTKNVQSIKSDVALLEQQLRVASKIEAIKQAGGAGVDGTKLKYCVVITIRLLEKSAKKLEEGDSTMAEVFDMMERLITARGKCEHDLELDWSFLEVIDGVIEMIFESLKVD